MATRKTGRIQLRASLEEEQEFRDYAEYRGLDLSSLARMLIKDAIRHDSTYQQYLKDRNNQDTSK